MNTSESLGKNEIPITFKGFAQTYEYPSLVPLEKWHSRAILMD